jgi:hypothetical protein
MTLTRLPSLDIPESEKRSYTEADVHSKLFEPDMAALGFPPRTNNQADGEWFQEQRAYEELGSRIFDLFEIHDSREEVLRFYESIGKVTKGSAETAQEASE